MIIYQGEWLMGEDHFNRGEKTQAYGVRGIFHKHNTVNSEDY